MCGWWGEGRSEHEASGGGRVIEGLGMRREPEGSGSEDTERGSGGGRA